MQGHLQECAAVAPGRSKLGVLAWTAIVVLVLGVLAGCGGDGDQEQQAQEEQAQGEQQTADQPPAFAYSGERGPENWGSLDPAYAQCSEGRRQSPVDLTGGETADLPAIDFAYRPAELEVENNGHSLEAEYPPGSSMAIDGTEYQLKQFHFHAPSEHRLGGRALPLEFHLVHEADDGRIAVLGVLVRQGRENPAFALLAPATPEEEGESVPVEGEVNARDVLPEGAASGPRWSYSGSLTTPPCTEGVRWEVLTDPIEMSAAQIESYTTAYESNNRPLQPLNDRRLRVSE
jgi:carbonic anhydrase